MACTTPWLTLPNEKLFGAREDDMRCGAVKSKSPSVGRRPRERRSRRIAVLYAIEKDIRGHTYEDQCAIRPTASC
jgi:hypothetical protein